MTDDESPPSQPNEQSTRKNDVHELNGQGAQDDVTTSANAVNENKSESNLTPPEEDHDYTARASSVDLSSSEDDLSDEEDTTTQDAKSKASKGGSNYPKDSLFAKIPAARLSISNRHFRAKSKVSKQDGRLKIAVHERSTRGYIARALNAGIRHHLSEETRRAAKEKLRGLTHADDVPEPEEWEETQTPPHLNIVIMVIGSRGDIQPFVKIGQEMKEKYGHRVRLATHPAFRDFVEKDCGLEFFSVGGDPSELMAFMVKNPGLIPSLDTVRKGEIGKRREAMAGMFEGFWRACIMPSDNEEDDKDDTIPPFVADVIIANPPSFAHVHCAERLGCPLHIIFTFPYTPTQHFSHPLANIKSGNVDHNYTNFMSYPLVDIMTWQGLGDLVNRFRVHTLALDPVSTIWAPCQLYRLKVPYTYLWSPSLVPKPDDWGPEIHIAGFVFLEAPSTFSPPQDLQEFLDAGDPPVYIGFGSIVVDDAQSFTQLIFDGVRKAGVRAVINKGWGGIGDEGHTPANIFMLDNIPHDWLFPRCSAVVHHGGAGTTAIGLKCARPTMIVPFFGDQPFWGAMVADAKAGAHECIPYKQLTSDKLAAGITQCLSAESLRNVQNIADSIAREGDGAANAIRYFHGSLPLHGPHSLRCSLLPSRAAVWRLPRSRLRLSALAAELLVRGGHTSYAKLALLRPYDWTDFQGAEDPVTGVTGAALRSTAAFSRALASGPVLAARDVRAHARYTRKKHQRAALAPTASHGSSLSRLRPHNALHTDILHAAGAGLAAPAAAIARAPVEILLGLSLGLHNAPRLYGDASVRRPRAVTGVRSGLRAGAAAFAKEGGDAVAGLWRMPVKGAREGGVGGFAAGVGKGVGGLVVKGAAAVVEPVAFAAKGVMREVVGTPMGEVEESRKRQGRREVEALGDEECEQLEKEVRKGWKVMVALWKEGEKLRRRSGILGGKVEWEREKRAWEKYGAFESVEASQRALEARRKGVELSKYMAERENDRLKDEPHIDAVNDIHENQMCEGVANRENAPGEAPNVK